MNMNIEHSHTVLNITKCTVYRTNMYCNTKENNIKYENKGTVWPDYICMRVVPLDRPWKGPNRYRFLIFCIMILNFLTEF
jgi:hypothetical protein